MKTNKPKKNTNTFYLLFWYSKSLENKRTRSLKHHIKMLNKSTRNEIALKYFLAIQSLVHTITPLDDNGS
jgi:hypothetical protein